MGSLPWLVIILSHPCCLLPAKETTDKEFEGGVSELSLSRSYLLERGYLPGEGNLATKAGTSLTIKQRLSLSAHFVQQEALSIKHRLSILTRRADISPT